MDQGAGDGVDGDLLCGRGAGDNERGPDGQEAHRGGMGGDRGRHWREDGRCVSPERGRALARCGGGRAGQASFQGSDALEMDRTMPDPNRYVRFETFRGTLEIWNHLFTQAADFATRIGRERLISISHSEDKDDGVVTVWYWDQPGDREG